jgi:large subunit ribosomal protein L34e
MVSGKFKSRSLRRIKIKTPNGTKTTYKYRKTSKPQCANCGTNLKGVPRGRKSEMVNMAKSKKRPERPYGGYLCSKCMRQVIKNKIRNN